MPSGRRVGIRASVSKQRGTFIAVPKGSKPLSAEERDAKVEQQRKQEAEWKLQEEARNLVRNNPFLTPSAAGLKK